jgi:peptidyl-dipeptidase A
MFFCYRYFLSDILQVQMFKGMCEVAVLGHVGTGQTLPMPLHHCDIYGSKQAGHKLR